jgi:hypothetical protein
MCNPELSWYGNGYKNFAFRWLLTAWSGLKGELATRQENAIFGNVSRAIFKNIFAYVDATSCDDERIPTSIE